MCVLRVLHQVETLRDVQETCLLHKTHQTWPHPLHETQHDRRKICLAPQLMTQQKKPGITASTACSLVTARPEEKNTGLLGMLKYGARVTDSTPPNP